MRTKHKFDLRAVSPAASRATRGNARSPYARSFNRGPARATVGHLSLGSESIGASTTARNDVLVPVPCSPEIIAESPPSSLTSPWPAAAGLEHIRLAFHDPGLMFVVKLAMTPLNVDLPDSVGMSGRILLEPHSHTLLAKIVIHDLSNGTAKYAAAATNTNTSSDASIPTTDHQAATSLCLPPRRRQPLTTLCPGDYHRFYNPDPVQEDKENSPDGGVGYAGTCDGEEADDEADDEHDEESEIDMEMNVPLVRPPDFCPKPFRHKVYLILEGRKPGIYADL